MRALCDACESAAAVLFCAADEAALCRNCDEEVHMCNKLASRHVRVGLADSSQVPRCDICEKSPAFFYCESDGSTLCPECDTTIHDAGKRTHSRYLMLRQRIEFPGDKLGVLDEQRLQTEPLTLNLLESNGKTENELIDLNAMPQRMEEQETDNEILPQQSISQAVPKSWLWLGQAKPPELP